MDYRRFLESLLGEGRALVPSPGAARDEAWEAGDRVLAEFERIWRRNLPEPVPVFDPASARWAAVWLYRACQFAVYRELEAEAIQEMLSGPFPGEITAEVCYSVDLTFRFLPDLERFTRSAAERDPLLVCLRERAREWPLSTVGMAGIGDVAIGYLAIGGFAKHSGLMQLYADRIIAAGDISRSADERVRSKIESSLGIFPELAPRLAAENSGSRVGNAK